MSTSSKTIHEATGAEDLQRWKQKYYDSLDTLEHKEAAWSQLESHLYRNMGQLALVLYGADSELDSNLDHLRSILRAQGNQAEVERAIGSLHALRSESERGQPTATANATLTLAKLAEDFVGRVLGHIQRPDLDTLRRELVSDPAPERVALIVDDVARICAELLSNASESGEAMEPDPAAMLMELLSRLDLPEGLAAQADAVRARLREPMSANEYPGIVAAIANLVSEVRRELQTQRVEIEGFLLGVNRRLRELGSFLDESEVRRQDSMDRVNTLRSGVDGEVASMRTDLHQAKNLDGLKAVVNTRLENISLHVERHLSAEVTQNAELKQSIEQLGGELQRANEEAEDLRSHLEAAKSAARHDGLTGLFNRAAFEEQAIQEHARWERQGTPLSLVVWDIDHFKNINDTFGHQAGDRVLKAIADLLRSHVRQTDFVARYGGEEMVVLMPNTPQSTAMAVAEQLRTTLENARFRYSDRAVQITASCGITEFRTGDSTQSAFKRADEALYEAKSDGRNCSRAA